jgi:hypothetical protein
VSIYLTPMRLSSVLTLEIGSATVIVPSFVAKIARAKKHLVDLETAVDAYAARKPYTVAETLQGKRKRKVRRLAFTADPANTDIPIIAADAIYNLRSSLDHLMAMLVPASRRRSVMFPVFWEGVWEPGVPGENEQRRKDRNRWNSCVKTLPNAAVAFLKTLQPPDDAGEGDEANLLEVVNRLSNRDRHQKLPVIAAGMRGVAVRFTRPDGKQVMGMGVPEPNSVFTDQAELDIPQDAVDVEIAGIPLIAIRVGQQNRHIEIPEKLTVAARVIEETIIPKLGQYVRA